MRPRISIRGSVRPSVRWSVGPSVGPSGTHFFSMSRLWGKMVGNDSETSLNAPNSSTSRPNCPKMSQNVQSRRIVVRTDFFHIFLLDHNPTAITVRRRPGRHFINESRQRNIAFVFRQNCIDDDHILIDSSDKMMLANIAMTVVVLAKTNCQ